MSNKIVPSIYRAVIDDVIASMKSEFEEYGVGEEVLAELQSKWETKVIASHVADFEPVAAPAPAPHPAYPPHPMHAMAHSHYPNHNPYAPQHHQLAPPQMQPGAPHVKTEPIDNRYMLKPACGCCRKSPKWSGASPSYGSLPPPGPAATAQPAPARVPQTDGPSSSSSDSPTPPPSQNYAPRSSHPSLPQPPTASAKPEDSEAINSDLDDSDSDNDQEGDEGGSADTDIVFCTYDKVARVKNKWKCILKDGMIHINGKDYLFMKCTGVYSKPSHNMKGVYISLLLAGLSQAVQVYLNPSPALPPRLSASRGSAALSRHLGLEQFEPLGEDSPLLNGQQESFVGQGLGSAMLLTISEEVAKDVIPSTLKLAFTLASKPSLSSLSILIPSYIDRAQHVYSHVFSQASAPSIPPTAEILSVLSPTFAPYLAEMTALVDFLESDEVPTDKFAAFALTGSQRWRSSTGAQPGLKLAVVTVPMDALVKRQDTDASDLLQPPQSPLPGPSPGPAEPIGSVSTCFESAAACGNATDGCSGHGECVQASKAGKTCFVDRVRAEGHQRAICAARRYDCDAGAADCGIRGTAVGRCSARAVFFSDYVKLSVPRPDQNRAQGYSPNFTLKNRG
ncbi:Transcription initiation factor IIA large subunit [Grifola frondosa]|uniref:Transcription initiation factor IIA large subunit n=1 Tax=Grifola frondosa TaxID=5627 RepID=A0A1C7M2N6_GRIFR|nr:Transcription initiation factor IIA large subunit [Grifola frondosa]